MPAIAKIDLVLANSLINFEVIYHILNHPHNALKDTIIITNLDCHADVHIHECVAPITSGTLYDTDYHSTLYL